MIRRLTTRSHFKHKAGRPFLLAGLIGSLFIAGSLFQESRTPIIQKSATPETDELSRRALLKDRRTYSSDTLAVADPATKTRLSEAYGKLPLSFEVNQGQVNGEVRFLARGSGYNFFLTPSEAVLAVRPSSKTEPPSSADLVETNIKPRPQAVLRIKLVGANPSAEITGIDEQPGKSNYFLGDDPQQWRTNVAHYARVQYASVYPGVNLVYYGNQRELEYDFVVNPGIDPNVIKLSYEGVRNLRIDREGDLVLLTKDGEFRQHRLSIYQETAGERKAISGRYKINGDREIGFELDAYDKTRTVVIDPVLAYSTYLGGAGSDVGYSIAVDPLGNAYITGATRSVNFPTVNSLPYGDRDGQFEDVFVTKLNAAGSALVYSTYLGGTGGGRDDIARAIAVDSSGNAYVTGSTGSSTFPTVNPLQSVFRGGRDAFVTKLNSSGSALVYSTFLGGSDSNEEARGIAVDSAGGAYITGYTRSTDFPMVNALYSSFGGLDDGFVAKLNPAGSALVYSTYLGGGHYDYGNAVAVDSSGSAYITGLTYSSNFPLANPLKATCGCFTGTCAGDGDVFVTKLNPAGSALVYSTYLGGSSVEEGRGIAVDSSGNAYITGNTGSNDFPTANPVQSTLGGGSAFCNSSDAFVTKLNSSGSALVYSTYLGGVNGDGASSIAVDSSGSAYITGNTIAGNFPTVDPSQSTIGGAEDAFVAKLNPAGSGLIFSTYLGGSNSDFGNGISLDSAGNAYVTGSTSGNFPTQNPFQPVFGGGNLNANESLDAFVAKIGSSLPPAGLSISAVTPNRGGNTGSINVSIHGSGFVNGATPKLQSAGQPDVNATSVGINNDGTVAIARFNLQGQAPGVRGVVMVNPGGASTISENAFTIEQGGGPQVWVDVVGRNVIRPGRPQTYYVYYGNRGNAEAYGVPLWITGIPKNAQVTLGFAVAQPPQPLGGYAVDYNQVPVVLEVATEKAVPLYLPVIRVGEAAALKITLTVPTPDPFVLRASTQTAIFNIITPIIVPGTSSPRQGIQSRDPATAPCPASSPRTSILNGGLESGLDCFNGLLSTGLSIAEAASPIPLPLRCGFSIAQSFAEEISTGYAGVTDPNANSTALSYVQTEVGVAGTALNCLEESVRTTIPPGRVIAGAQAVLSIPQTVASCGGFVSSLLGINFAFSLDPNDKIGSRGSGPDHFISGAEPLRYLIFFENLESATAPAQDVVITDQLDPAKLNFDTFSFGPISFGADKHVVPPAGLSAFNKDVDLRPAKNLIVRVEAKLEKETGLLTWRFTSLDPATGLPTDDPTAGFLPPNHTPPEGEGQVLFTVQTKQGLATGTEIRNRARIVFDTNAPIDTPEWLNTIDNSKPTSHVLQLEQTQSFVVFKVSWTGSDTGSGVKSYSVYSSENGEPFTPWLVDATATSAWFVGQPAKTYSFYTIARDATGNLEPPKTAAEATTTTTSAIINSIDDQRFFVYQHYADFLNRVPDEAGLDFWTRQITDCGSDQTCVELKRINVSAAFFLSIEFQETGYLVYRTYKAAYGNLAGAPIPLRLNEFLPDTRQIGQGVVVGQAGWEQVLENNKQIFAENLVARSRFTDSHSTALTPAAFVDTLFMNAAVLPTVAERTAAINEFGGAGNTSNAPARARALRRVAEHSTLKQQEFNKAFVLMQYFGYLRRNPNDPPEPMLDFGGYNFWLAKLDQFNGNFVNADMVKAFIVSAEYRQRFGP